MMPPNPLFPNMYLFHQSIRDHNVPHRDGAAEHGARAHETLYSTLSPPHPDITPHTFELCAARRSAEPQRAQQRQPPGWIHTEKGESLGRLGDARP